MSFVNSVDKYTNLYVQAAEGEAAKKEERPKSPGLLAKLLAPFKNEKKGEKEKKVKAPKSPKAAKKKEVSEVGFNWFSFSK